MRNAKSAHAFRYSKRRPWERNVKRAGGTPALRKPSVGHPPALARNLFLGRPGRGREKFGSAASKPAPFAGKKNAKAAAPPRVSIMHGVNPVPRGWIRHPPGPPAKERACFPLQQAASVGTERQKSRRDAGATKTGCRPPARAGSKFISWSTGAANGSVWERGV
jgi:hypothetical protein